MSSAAQILANQSNALHSTGPFTEAEYNPQTREEDRLVHAAIQH